MIMAKPNNPAQRRAEATSTTIGSPESLSPTETLGGYIFICDNDTEQECLRRQLFGLSHRYIDSVRSIRPGLPLFLHNYETGRLHGIFEATSFGGFEIDPSAWPDMIYPGQSRFPAQVRVKWKDMRPPLEINTFRPFLGELTTREALDILDSFKLRSSSDMIRMN